jgi:hypothetical protein
MPKKPVTKLQSGKPNMSECYFKLITSEPACQDNPTMPWMNPYCGSMIYNKCCGGKGSWGECLKNNANI